MKEEIRLNIDECNQQYATTIKDYNRKVPNINEIDRSLKKIASDICTLSAIFSKFVRMTEEGERKDG